MIIERYDSVEGYQIFLDSFGNMGGICNHIVSEIRDEFNAPILLYSAVEENNKRTQLDSLSWNRVNEMLTMVHLWESFSTFENL